LEGASVIAQVLARNWWLLALRGAIAIVFGVAAILWPVVTILVLALLVGAYLFVDGLIAIFYGLWGHRGWWLVAQGILGVAVGIIAWLIPGITALGLVFLIAIWAILRGVAEIVIASQLGRMIGAQLYLVLAGALSVLFGIAVFFFPAAGTVAIAWLIGVYAIVLGVLLVVGALRVRAWAQVDRLIAS